MRPKLKEFLVTAAWIVFAAVVGVLAIIGIGLLFFGHPGGTFS